MSSGEQISIAIAERRKNTADEVRKNPERYCVCEGCSSLLVRDKIKRDCPVCKAYRFDESREAVLAAADVVGAKPFADTCAFIPRFAAHANHA
jgi:hypothetical protein